MNESKLVFYVMVIAILGFCAMVTHCTYQEGSCKKDAIKAGMKADEIHTACHIG